ncbi:hypothetical protein HJ171_05970 [Vibrio parahaemolyticus]|nr:hypothetical protein [Vibrio parahaemolyticus]
MNEVKVMIERFNLLDRQYSSDISRLENISEVGNLFIALPEDNCPLCGSVPLEDNEHNLCDGDVDRLVESAIAEKNKLFNLQLELSSTLENLNGEYDFLYNNQEDLASKLEEQKSKVIILNDI